MGDQIRVNQRLSQCHNDSIIENIERERERVINTIMQIKHISY